MGLVPVLSHHQRHYNTEHTETLGLVVRFPPKGVIHNTQHLTHEESSGDYCGFGSGLGETESFSVSLHFWPFDAASTQIPQK